MHIMEGFLPWYWCLFWFIVSAPFLVYGAKRIGKIFEEHPEQKLTVALSGAFIFVLSALKLPSVTGSSSHPTGTGMSAVLYGPGVTSVLAIIVLLFQALLLVHGGITTLGANVFSMGIAGPLVAYFVFRSMQRAGAPMAPSVFAAAFLADFVTYAVTSLQLALAFPTNGSVMASFATFFVVFAITQIPLAIAEGILMVIFFDYLARSRSDVLEGKVRLTPAKLSRKALYIAGLVAVVGIIASAYVLNPGGQFRGSDDQGTQVIQQVSGGFDQWFSGFYAPSSDLQVVLFALQAAIGISVIAAVVWYFKKGAAKRKAGE